jgi:DNA-binding transcriptional regulator LsrR (DeoR family)
MAAVMHLAYAQGATLRSLAAAAGMSHEQVRRIVQERHLERRRGEAVVSHFVTM